MHRLFKKYQKKVLAIVTVLLMIAFVATLSTGGSGGHSRTNVVVGHMGKTPLYESEMRIAKDEWTWLNRYIGRGMFGQQMSLPAMAFTDAAIGGNPLASRDYRLRLQAEQVGSQLSANIDKHPELFLLLQKEAQQDGLRISADEAKSFMVNRLRIPAESLSEQRGAVEATQSLLLVGAELRHLMDAMKISRPVWQHDAAQGQSVRLDLIDFQTSDFEKSVPAPTPQQLKQQFEKYKDTPPGMSSGDNPLGLGYQIPTHVKLQYIEIPRSQVVDAVIHHISPSTPVGAPADAGDSQYEWEVQAALYYNSHQDEFRNTPAATQPATQPGATQPSTQPTTQTAAATTQPTSQPAVKPFAEVKQQIIDKLTADDVEKQTALIAKDVTSQLAADWIKIRQTDPAATQPISPAAGSADATTRPADELMTLAHLEQLRNDIAQKYHVAIQLHDIVNGWQSLEQLAKLPGIGTANTPDNVSFPDYATSFARPPGSLAVASLQVWEPSQPLTNQQQDVYVFRLTAAQPAHAPADMTTIAKQVEQDWKLAQAYDRAKQAAQQALNNAESSGLTQAARVVSQNVTATPLFPPQRVQEVPGYPLPTPAATDQLLKAAAELIQEATPSEKHPDKLVELPSARRVLVVELGTVQLDSPEWLEQYAMIQRQQMARIQKLADEWFSYDSVVSRLKYKAEEKS